MSPALRLRVIDVHTSVSVNEMREPLKTNNTVTGDCESKIFTGCRDITPEMLRVLSIYETPAGDVKVKFRDADTEAHIPYISTLDSWNLITVVTVVTTACYTMHRCYR